MTAIVRADAEQTLENDANARSSAVGCMLVHHYEEAMVSGMTILGGL